MSGEELHTEACMLRILHESMFVKASVRCAMLLSFLRRCHFLVYDHHIWRCAGPLYVTLCDPIETSVSLERLTVRVTCDMTLRALRESVV